jgi:SAM-dependent methyltransferase
MSAPNEQGHPSDPWARPDERYATRPRWDIGRPQPALLNLAEAGDVRGRVLDAGCGTGEHALMAARLGLDATGIDLAANALERAREKARERGLEARFLQYDARKLTEFGEQFDTVVDCGLFHLLHRRGEDRAAYVDGLRSVVRPGGRYLMLGFRGAEPDDREPDHPGPRRLTREDLEAAFAEGWRIDSVEPTTIDSLTDPEGVPAWVVAVTRVTNATDREEETSC